MEETALLRQLSLSIKLLKLETSGNFLKDDKTLLQMESAVKFIGGCTGQRETVSQALSSYDVASVLKELMQTLRRHMNKRTWPCVMALRSACISLTNSFGSFCNDLCSVGFITILVKELKVYSKVKLEQNVSFDVCI